MMPLLVLALLRATGSVPGRGRYAVPAPGERRFTEKPPAKPGINGTPSWTAAAAAGLALAVVTAAAPSLLLPAVVRRDAVRVLLGRRGRTVWWALLPSLALFVPVRPLRPSTVPAPCSPTRACRWALTPRRSGSRPWASRCASTAGAGLTGLPGLRRRPAVPWALLLALLIGLPVLLLAVTALFLPGRRAAAAGPLARASGPRPSCCWPAAGSAGHVATGASAERPGHPLHRTGRVGRRLRPAGRGADRRRGLLDAADRAAAATAGRKVLVRAHRRHRHGAPARRTAGRAHGVGRAQRAAAGRHRPPRPAPAGAARPRPSIAGVRRRHRRRPRQPARSGTPRLVQAGRARTLPATAIDRGEGPEQSRTLVISAQENGTFAATLMRGAGTTLDALSAIASARPIMGEPGQETVRDDDAVAASLRNVVATIVAGQGVDPRAAARAARRRLCGPAGHRHCGPADGEPDGRRPRARRRRQDRRRLAVADQPAERAGSPGRRRRAPRADRRRRRAPPSGCCPSRPVSADAAFRPGRKAGWWSSPNVPIRAGAPGSTAAA